jgi:hypothetical protein
MIARQDGERLCVGIVAQSAPRRWRMLRKSVDPIRFGHDTKDQAW